MVVTGAEVDVSDVTDAVDETGALLEITVDETGVEEATEEEVEVVLGAAEEVVDDCEEGKRETCRVSTGRKS